MYIVTGPLYLPSETPLGYRMSHPMIGTLPETCEGLWHTRPCLLESELQHTGLVSVKVHFQNVYRSLTMALRMLISGWLHQDI